MDAKLRKKLLAYQKNEITEHHIYAKLAERVRQPENRRVLENIAQDELRHYYVWKAHTLQDVGPASWTIRKYYWLSRILGYTFGVKLMEREEKHDQGSYEPLRGVVPEADAIFLDENQHEASLLRMLDEERLRYSGSMVLGLNDAVVELTGALAGFTLALRDSELIALIGFITGIAAALSMGASEYLSTKTEKTDKNPVQAALYTGGTYLVTVLLLVLPYLILENYYLSLGCTLAASISIIALFNYYISVAKDEQFGRRFAEMAVLSLSIAAFSFLLGFLLRSLWGIDI